MARLRSFVALLLLAVVCQGCATRAHLRSSPVEFLYPSGTPAIRPADVTLKLPLRVGAAFIPDSQASSEGLFQLTPTLSEIQKQALLARIGKSFEAQAGLDRIDIIPSLYLRPGGSFGNVDQIATMFGIDVIALIGVDQVTFNESTRGALTYWTVVGAYVVPAEKHETRTVLETAVYDIRSRTLLFRASGTSSIGGKSAPRYVERDMRLQSERGFSRATEDLIDNLDTALKTFRETIKSGTVRGVGTPAIQVIRDKTQGAAPGGAGSLGLIDLVAVACVVFARARRR